MHGQVLEALRSTSPDGEEPPIEQLAFHAMRAERWHDAVDYNRLAGTNALARTASRSAIEFYQDALAAHASHLFGLFFFSVNSLTQAAAIDHVSGKGLDATFIGLMWGSNAFFGAGAALFVGWLVDSLQFNVTFLGFQFDSGWAVALYFGSALFFVGLLVVCFLAVFVFPAGFQAVFSRRCEQGA